jgi:prophage maintenance system killer protein
MHYLTVQDVLWIHLQIAKKKGTFSFAKLEEATSYQYAYGKSHDVTAQAARFFPGFVKMSPFGNADQAVAFVSGLTFLELNGLTLKPSVKDPAKWFGLLSDSATSLDNVLEGTEPSHGDHHASCREVAKAIISKYEKSIAKLLE